jgi:hypothetical protein
MTIISKIKNRSLLNFFVFSPSSNRTLSLLRKTLLSSLLIGLICLTGISIKPASAAPNATSVIPGAIASLVVDSTSSEDDRMSALIACLPKQLSQPNLGRALSEMGNDQLERAFNLKANPKRSQAETDLASCLNRPGS